MHLFSDEALEELKSRESKMNAGRNVVELEDLDDFRLLLAEHQRRLQPAQQIAEELAASSW